MTKDGRNSLITNIRLFIGDHSHSSRYVENMEEAVAYGRRMAWFLNSESFSLGAFPELYVCSLPRWNPVQFELLPIQEHGGIGTCTLGSRAIS